MLHCQTTLSVHGIIVFNLGACLVYRDCFVCEVCVCMCVCACVCMCVCMRVSTPRTLIIIHVKCIDNNSCEMHR